MKIEIEKGYFDCKHCVFIEGIKKKLQSTFKPDTSELFKCIHKRMGIITFIRITLKNFYGSRQIFEYRKTGKHNIILSVVINYVWRRKRQYAQ